MLLVVSSGDEQEAEGDAAVAAEFPMITAAPGPGMDVPRRALRTRGKIPSL